MDVTLNNVGLGLVGSVWPIADVSDAAKQEDAFALTPADLGYDRVTGFMIQMDFWSLHLLNYSLKMGY